MLLSECERMSMQQQAQYVRNGCTISLTLGFGLLVKQVHTASYCSATQTSMYAV